ncbi:DUF2510 domain-containing protein [Rathayibacter sp. VKM Ac-2759]|uniref:DUF2510 domain-containing protein n=1 Tax=Rathayibacter sp. VKM Ac-2759 TaxID=2609252 RepID=UPI001319713C|nr:DUF2510 domain-containing protein [Rathayibacter sp. VKM Ac-2759]QHC67155.1 DUF2510 domain-containing protein [Rathayibacter sp. VKM Ac-2759]
MDEDVRAPAGWYPEGGAMRWWDGARWTEDRMSAKDGSPADVRPPSPARTVLRLPNADGTPTVDAIDEAERIEEIADALGRPVRPGEVVEESLDVELIPEPDHPTGAPAVSVRARGRVIGYLPDAASYRPAIDRIVASGVLPVTGARLRVERGEEGLRASLRLALPSPDLVVPLNAPPTSPYSVLPWGRGLQVLREDEHFAQLTGLVEGRGLVLVTLHLLPSELVEVRLDGARVGELSTGTSPHFAPTVRHLEGLGLTATAYAALRSSPLKAELTLQAARASELPAPWVDGPAVTLPALVPTAARYDVPDAYVRPLRRSSRTSEAVTRSTRRVVAWVVFGVATLVGLSSWIIGDVLN